jgi:phospholipase/carboxylesterase
MNEFISRFEPSEGSTNATVLALHGTGGTENDLIPLAQSLWPRANVLAPRGRVLEHGMPRFFRRIAEGVFDLDSLRRETAALADFVAERAHAHAFDANNVWALGYSNGANIAASLLLSRPETLAGAVLLRAMTPFEAEQIPDLSGKRVLLLAGRFDPMVPVANIENLARLLKTGGADVTVHFAEAGHELTRPELDAARDWLASRA